MNTAKNVRDFEEEPLPENIESLAALGLTHRQAEVAFWIAQGKANDELAIILKASRHTIPHHVEAILARLHLATRAEIMLCVLETLGWLRWPTKRRVTRIASDRNDKKIASKDLASPKARRHRQRCLYTNFGADSECKTLTEKTVR